MCWMNVPHFGTPPLKMAGNFTLEDVQEMEEIDLHKMLGFIYFFGLGLLK